MIGLAMFLVFAGLVVFSALWRGFVLTLLWAWFAQPVFGLPALGLAQAIGVSLTIGFLTHEYADCAAKEGTALERAARPLVQMILGPLFALLIGWVVKQWM